MIEELREKLPDEIVWNIIKILGPHPCAEMLKPACEDFSRVKRKFQFNRFLLCHDYILERNDPLTCYDCGVYLYDSNRSKRCNGDRSSCYDKRQLYYRYLRGADYVSASDSDYIDSV